MSADESDELPLPGRVGERWVPDPPPDEIAELCEACRQYVLGAVGTELDYTPETLPLLDHYLKQARASLEERPELGELVTRSAGAYFGEVMRRLAPSFWLLPSMDRHDWLICYESAFLAQNPVGVVCDVLYETSEHQGPSAEVRIDRDEREAVDRRLSQLSVPEDEYYTLSTRYEVMEIIFDQLRIEMQRAGTDDVRFESADYEDFPKPLGQA